MNPVVLPEFSGLLVNGIVVTDGESLNLGWIAADAGVITAMGTGDPTDNSGSRFDAAGRMVFPGFIDLHCHGGGGASFSATSQAEIRTAIDFHRKHGTTTIVASLISAPHDELMRSCEMLGNFASRSDIGGIHLEGPYLAHARCGAHDPRHLRQPSLEELEELVSVSKHTIVQVTIAPELPGALHAIRWLVRNGIVAAVGHTDATGGQVTKAIEAGATLATHLCNAMPPMHHREPCAVFALLHDERVAVEIINDGVHLHPYVVSTLAARAGRLRTVFITDAIAAAGEGDGPYELGGLAAIVTDGVARLSNAVGTIAGSTLTMDVAVQNALRGGLRPQDVAAAAATVPARVLGLGDRGSIAVGKRADLVVL